MKDLANNSLIEWLDLQDDSERAGEHLYPHLERVIHLEQPAFEVVVIEVFNPTAMPRLRFLDQIERAHREGLLRFQDHDPFESQMRPEDLISAKHKEYRDRAWEQMAPLLEHEEVNLMLNAHSRNQRITEHCKRTQYFSQEKGKLVQLSKVTAFNRLRLWWQSGRRRNAYLPNFDNCGAPGESRLSEFSETNKDKPKLGRRSIFELTQGEAETGVGIRMTLQIYRKFEFGYKKFFKRDKRSLKDTYDLTIKEYFHKTIEIRQGVPVKIPLDEHERPTFEQFRYWYNNNRDIVDDKKKREGEKEFNLKSRRVTGESTHMSFGPGRLYQIDATIPNIYLVSSLDRSHTIGRPVLYNCVDVFSRILVGFSVTLEGPSWIGGMLALDNATRNKVEFCSEYDIKIEEWEWPSGDGLCWAFLADRGEFAGYNANNLVNALGMREHNTGVFRPDWKAIVERSFGLAREKVTKFTPGYVPIRSEARTDPDCDLKAVLTLNEFRKLLTYYALDYNMNHYLSKYRKNEFMIADKVERYPLDIWNWGINNRGPLRPIHSQDIVRLNLMPRMMASITPQGIYMPGTNLYYECDYILGQMDIARIKKANIPIEIAHDPRTTKRIYLPLDKGLKMEICERTAACRNLPALDWHEARDLYALETAEQQTQETRRLTSSAVRGAQKQDLVVQATEKTLAAKAAAGPQSKRSQRQSRSFYRELEKQKERQRDAWSLGVNGGSDDHQARSSEPSEDNVGYIPPTSNIDLIRKILEGEFHNEE